MTQFGLMAVFIWAIDGKSYKKYNKSNLIAFSAFEQKRT